MRALAAVFWYSSCPDFYGEQVNESNSKNSGWSSSNFFASLPLAIILALAFVIIADAIDKKTSQRSSTVGKMFVTFLENWAVEFENEKGDLVPNNEQLILSDQLAMSDHQELAFKAELLVDEFDAAYIERAFEGSSVLLEIQTIVDDLRKLSAIAARQKGKPVDRISAKKYEDSKLEIRKKIESIAQNVKDNIPDDEFYLMSRVRSEPEKEWTQVAENYINVFDIRLSQIFDSEGFSGNVEVEYLATGDADFVRTAESVTEICRRSRVLYLLLISLDENSNGLYDNLISKYVVRLEEAHTFALHVVGGSDDNLSERSRGIKNSILRAYAESIEKRLTKLRSLIL